MTVKDSNEKPVRDAVRFIKQNPKQRPKEARFGFVVLSTAYRGLVVNSLP